MTTLGKALSAEAKLSIQKLKRSRQMAHTVPCKYVPESDDDSFDLLSAAVAEECDRETYAAIMRKLELLYEKQNQIRAEEKWSAKDSARD